MSTNNKKILQSEDKRLQASTEALQNMKTIKVFFSFTYSNTDLDFEVELLGKHFHGKNQPPQKEGADSSCQGLIVLVCNGVFCKYFHLVGDYYYYR